MAYSKEQWKEAKFLWELDKPLSYIVEKTGISKAQISKKSNKEEVEKGNKRKHTKAFNKGIRQKKRKLWKQKGNDIISKLCIRGL